MNERKPSRTDEILDLLVDEMLARMRLRDQSLAPPEPAPIAPSVPPAGVPDAPVVETSAEIPSDGEMQLREEEREAGPVWQPPSLDPSHLRRLMGRLALGLLIAIVLINIPFNRHGTTLATAMPDTAAVLIRDGLVVKERGDEDIYVYQDGEFRWISSLDAFQHLRFTWNDVHVVEDGFLDEFRIGPALHVLLKCSESPHIYRLEGGLKRWIVDIRTFEAEGHEWDDVRIVSCHYLRDLPDGDTIPPDQGPPPQP